MTAFPLVPVTLASRFASSVMVHALASATKFMYPPESVIAPVSGIDLSFSAYKVPLFLTVVPPV